MCPPFRPGAIHPALRTYRPDPTSRDRKRKGRSFEDEMGHQEDEPQGHQERRPAVVPRGGARSDRARPTRAKGPKRSDAADDGRRHIDLEI